MVYTSTPKTPLEYLKKSLDGLKSNQAFVQSRLDELDEERDKLMDEYKEIGLAIIELKAFIAKNEEPKKEK